MYARLVAGLSRRRTSIATMDLLIGTAGLVEDAALLTRNRKDFSKIPGLHVLGY
jgi:predicted nucleic acid-binding protein